MRSPSIQAAPAHDRPDRFGFLGPLAVAAAGMLVAALSVRPITSYDIGYHLAYGGELLDHGRTVDTNRFIYTRLDANRLADPDQLGPGCRYDPPLPRGAVSPRRETGVQESDQQSGEYSFVNLNWLSQGVFATVERVAGWTGLCLLRAVLVMGMVAMVAWLMRRRGVGWAWVAAGIILTAMASYERFDLRPELLSYVILLGQWALLSGERIGWRRAAGVIGLQVIAVNVHSYFPLGVLLCGLVLAEAVLRWLWARTVARTDPGELAGRLTWLTVAAVGTIAACLANPWFVRGAVFPIQTLIYLRRHGIMGPPTPGNGHPWARIGELVPTFQETVWSWRPTWAFVVVLIVGAVGGVAALGCRRWARVGVLAVMAAVSVATRRNMALGAVFIVPVALIAIAEAAARLRERFGRRALAARAALWVRRGVAIATVALAGWWTAAVVTSEFYFATRRVWRFGLGVSRVMLPVDAAEWVNRRQPAGRLWCDFRSSSNLLFLTGGRYEVPVLTNTFAMPPYVMGENLAMTSWPGEITGFPKFIADYDVGTAVVGFTTEIPLIVGVLSGDPNWAPVQIGVRDVVFVRRDGPAGALAASDGLTEATFDIDRYVRHVAATDPVSEYALYDAGRLMQAMNWPAHAARLWREALARRPDYSKAAEALEYMTGQLPETCLRQARQLVARANRTPEIVQRFISMGLLAEARAARRSALQDLQLAERLLDRALALRPEDKDARQLLADVRQALAKMTTQPARQATTEPATSPSP